MHKTSPHRSPRRRLTGLASLMAIAILTIGGCTLPEQMSSSSGGGSSGGGSSGGGSSGGGSSGGGSSGGGSSGGGSSGGGSSGGGSSGGVAVRVAAAYQSTTSMPSWIRHSTILTAASAAAAAVLTSTYSTPWAVVARPTTAVRRFTKSSTAAAIASPSAQNRAPAVNRATALPAARRVRISAESSGGGAGNGGPGGASGAASPLPDDIGDGQGDNIVERQIREAAMRESDPVLREKLWDEYRRVKGQE